MTYGVQPNHLHLPVLNWFYINGFLQHRWHMKQLNGVVQPTAHVDVSPRRQVALVTHQTLQGVRREPISVLSRERPPQVVETV